MTKSQKPSLKPEFIHSEAVKIIKRLQDAGFITYLVGGCVRDLLSGFIPKDFDIATTASPKQVKKVISEAYIIGRRFRLVLVKRGIDQFEVATFRRDPNSEELAHEEELIGDNIFGSPEEDALRRDFTLNGLFYDPIREELIDYCNGLVDVKSKIVRMIGDPHLRLNEDPIRILRALRLSHKLDFSIESHLRAEMVACASCLKKSALPRRREELLKILRLKDPTLTLMEAYDLKILKEVFPTLESIYENPDQLREFNLYMRRIHSFVVDINNPAELFGYLMLAYYRSSVESDPFKKVSASDLLKDGQLKKIMSEEFGMYNIEQTMFCKALEFQSKLMRVDKIGTRGDYLPLAIMLAKADHILSSEKIQKWEDFLQKNSSSFSSNRKKESRSRTSRRNMRKP